MVEGQNQLETAMIALKDSIDYEEDTPFIVKNTENFGFLKADYREKMKNTDKKCNYLLAINVIWKRYAKTARSMHDKLLKPLKIKGLGKLITGIELLT